MANENRNEQNANYFYPDDVDSTQEKAGKVSEGELSKLFFTFLGLFDVFGIFAFPTFLENLGIGLFGSILILVILNIILFLTIFRFMIFDENKKAREYRAHTSDSFARFFKINKNTIETMEIRGYGEAQLFQYNNGHYVVALRLRYGSSDTEKALNTREAYERIYRLLGQHRMEFKLLSTSENFRESAEYARYRDRQNKSKYKELSNHIFENLMKYTDEYSNVTMNTLLIRTTSKGQTLDLPLVLSEIVRHIEMYNTSIRGVEFLEFNQFIEFIREYYGLEAIDLSRLKDMEQNFAELNRMLKEVGVFEIRSGNDFKRSKSAREDIEGKMFTGTEEV